MAAVVVVPMVVAAMSGREICLGGRKGKVKSQTRMVTFQTTLRRLLRVSGNLTRLHLARRAAGSLFPSGGHFRTVLLTTSDLLIYLLYKRLFFHSVHFNIHDASNTLFDSKQLHKQLISLTTNFLPRRFPDSHNAIR